MNFKVLASMLAIISLQSFTSSHVDAADDGTTVNVALLDMSSTMGTGMMGRGWGMMGNGQGMMGMGNGQGMMEMGMMGMGMMSIRLDHSNVKAGKIHFAVINWSRAMAHEMLVVAVENPNAPLPYDFSAANVAEEQIKSLGEVDKLEANGSGSLDVNLTAGTYLLFCNVEGHYAGGMFTPLTVTP